MAAFERQFDEWVQDEYHHHHVLFEEQQQEAYQCALAYLPAPCQPQEQHQQVQPPEEQQQVDDDVEVICQQQ